jgi:hypothetical protein
MCRTLLKIDSTCFLGHVFTIQALVSPRKLRDIGESSMASIEETILGNGKDKKSG